MEAISIKFISILTGFVMLFISGMFGFILWKIREQDNKRSSMWNKIDGKLDWKSYEKDKETQTKINIDIIERLAKIETKIDILLNGGKTHE
jgi:hypothetical protein